MSRIATCTVLAAGWAALVGCSSEGGAADAATEDAALDVPPGGYASIVPNTAFEGVSWLVVSIEPADATVDLTGAVVSVDTHTEHVHVTEQACNRVRCAAVLAIDEFIDPIAQPVPRPIDAQNVTIRVDPPSGRWVAATLSVFPLDYASHSSAASPLRLRGTFLMSSFTMTGGAQLLPHTSDLLSAGRLFVTGPVVIEGGVDFSGGDAAGTAPGGAAPAGGGGGAPGAAGQGAGAGQGGLGGGAGGGGSYGGTGNAGADGAGTGGAAGSPYGDMSLESLLEGLPASGGSGGGGGADAAGGGGGGALLVVSLHSVTFGDAVIDAAGGAGGVGESGGGGGSGGAVLIAAPAIEGTASVTVTGGAAGEGTSASGGGGGAGRIRVDGDLSSASLTVEPGFFASGPVIDRDGLELIDGDGTMTVTGTAEAESLVTVEVIPESSGGGAARTFSTTAGGTGAFELDVELEPGASRLVVRHQAGGAEQTAVVGNTFVVAGSSVIGTALYVASVPAGE